MSFRESSCEEVTHYITYVAAALSTFEVPFQEFGVSDDVDSFIFFLPGVGRMDDTHIIRYGTGDRESSTRKAGNTRCTPRTGNVINRIYTFF